MSRRKTKERLPHFKFGTVLDLKTDTLLWPECVELFWNFQPDEGVSFYLPIRDGQQYSMMPDDELLLTYGSQERLVRVVSVGPSLASRSAIRVEARGFRRW